MLNFSRRLKNTCGAIFGVLVAACAQQLAAQPIAIVNPDFEITDPTDWAQGWEVMLHAGEPAYNFTLDRSQAFSGKQSARIEQYAPQVFGLFKQRLDARAWVGKRIALSAQVRAQNIGEPGGGLYFRVDGAGSVILASDFDSGNTTGSHDWKRLRAVIEIPLGAMWLDFGAMMRAKGILWVDAVTVELTTDAETKPKPSLDPIRPLLPPPPGSRPIDAVKD